MQVPLIDDFHVHLRQGALMKAVTPLLEQAGVVTAYVMVCYQQWMLATNSVGDESVSSTWLQGRDLYLKIVFLFADREFDCLRHNAIAYDPTLTRTPCHAFHYLHTPSISMPTFHFMIAQNLMLIWVTFIESLFFLSPT
jgi:hypothetical protein